MKTTICSVTSRQAVQCVWPIWQGPPLVFSVQNYKSNSRRLWDFNIPSHQSFHQHCTNADSWKLKQERNELKCIRVLHKFKEICTIIYWLLPLTTHNLPTTFCEMCLLVQRQKHPSSSSLTVGSEYFINHDSEMGSGTHAVVNNRQWVLVHSLNTSIFRVSAHPWAGRRSSDLAHLQSPKEPCPCSSMLMRHILKVSKFMVGHHVFVSAEYDHFPTAITAQTLQMLQRAVLCVKAEKNVLVFKYFNTFSCTICTKSTDTLSSAGTQTSEYSKER